MKTKILKYINNCKKSHQGPVTTPEELCQLIDSWEGTEKALHTALNYEICLCKFSFTKVKADSALFKQMKLSIKEKKKNLLSLISTQLEFKTQADMSDLEAAMKESNEIIVDEANQLETETNIDHSSDLETCDVEEKEHLSEFDSDIWPPKVGEMANGLFEDGVFPGEVIKVSNETVNMDILVPAKVPHMSDESLWKKPSACNT